ncbi:MAG: ATP-grasp domain-containing protein [Candidatus Lokiarchaeota archaeon]
MNSQEIFIFEYISGGGFNRIQIPSSLLCEGYSMLRSLISDFSKVGFKIKTLLDKRIEFLSSFLDADKILSVSSKENFITKFSQMLNETTYCFIIAPEFSKILYNLTKKALKSKSILLSQNVKAIKLGSSKFVTFDYFKKKRLPTPRTFKFNVRDGIFEIEKLFREGKIKFPFIIKPDEGVGAENVFLVQSTNSLTYIFNHLEDILKDNKYVVQEYIDGIGLSGSILGIKNTQRITKSRCKLLSINFQNISFKDEFHDSEYLGGYTPYDVEESLKKKIRIYLKLLKSPDLSGYFGVDFVLSNEKINFIEINPRLTTSYLGLRNVLGYNPAEIIYKAK